MDSVCDFSIVKRISSGAFGSVYIATKNSKVYALKAMSKYKLGTKDSISDALTECKVMYNACINNPFSAKLYSTFQSDENLFFVMEYVRGGNLDTKLLAKDYLSEIETRSLVAELVLAIEALHTRGIIHRDLKPENILFDENGHVKITDFGLSHSAEGCEAFALGMGYCGTCSKCKTRRQVGSPNYMAPEVAKGKSYSFKVDWWALGCLMFEMLTGRDPFEAPDLHTMLDNILFGYEPTLWSLGIVDESSISADAKHLVSILLRSDHNVRPSFNEIKTHKFFAGIDWDNILAKPNPFFAPKTANIYDTSNFYDRTEKKQQKQPFPTTTQSVRLHVLGFSSVAGVFSD